MVDLRPSGAGMTPEERMARYMEAAVESALDALAGTGAGGRNDALHRAAYSLGGLVPHGLDADATLAALVDAARAAGLPAGEAQRTARGGLDAGRRAPRELPGELADALRMAGGTVRVKARRRAPRLAPVDAAGVVPPEGVRAVLRALWDAIEGAPLPPPALAWLDARALDAGVAHDTGCRVPDAETLRAVFNAHGREAFTAAGLLRAGGHPAHRMQGDGERRRLWVPVWSPVWPDAPVAYRWRALWPDARVKACGMATADFPWRDWPLGVRWAVSLWGGERGDPAPVVVCEGEPDWLTLAGALEPGAVVLGMPGTAGWRAHWWELLRDAPALVVAMHADAAGQKAVQSIGEAVARAIPDKAERPPRTSNAPPAGGDWNDAWMASGRAGVASLIDLVLEARERGRKTA